MNKIYLLWSEDSEVPSENRPIYNDFVEVYLNAEDEQSFTLIDSYQRYIKEIEKKQPFSDAKTIFIQAEIRWEKLYNYHSKYFGFDIIKELRYKLKVRCEIVICSVVERAFFLNKTEEKFLITGKSGMNFLKLPFNEKKVNQAISSNKLELQQLEDINSACYNPIDVLKEFLHELKNNASKPNFNLILDKFFSDIEFLIQSQNSSKFSSIRQHALDTVNNQTKTNSNIVANVSDDLIELLKLDSEVSEETEYIGLWELILIDDNRDSIKSLEQKVADKIPYHYFSYADEALHYIDNQPNKCYCVLSDYRFVSKENERDWQIVDGDGNKIKDIMQGPQVMQELKKRNKSFIWRALLTSKGNKVNKGAFQRSDILFSKEKEGLLSAGSDYAKGALADFTNRIIEYGNAHYQAMLSLPEGATWLDGDIEKKDIYPLKHFYNEYRNSKDYNDLENEIDQTSEKIINEIMFRYEEGKDFEIIEDIPELSESKNVKFGIKIKGPEYVGKNAIAFKDRLVGRRVALYLSKIEGFSKADIYFAIHKEGKKYILKHDKKHIRKLNQKEEIRRALVNQEREIRSCFDRLKYVPNPDEITTRAIGILEQAYGNKDKKIKAISNWLDRTLYLIQNFDAFNIAITNVGIDSITFRNDLISFYEDYIRNQEYFSSIDGSTKSLLNSNLGLAESDLVIHSNNNILIEEKNWLSKHSNIFLDNENVQKIELSVLTMLHHFVKQECLNSILLETSPLKYAEDNSSIEVKNFMSWERYFQYIMNYLDLRNCGRKSISDVNFLLNGQGQIIDILENLRMLNPKDKEEHWINHKINETLKGLYNLSTFLNKD
jgi:hypothetical protein